MEFLLEAINHVYLFTSHDQTSDIILKLSCLQGTMPAKQLSFFQCWKVSVFVKPFTCGTFLLKIRPLTSSVVQNLTAHSNRENEMDKKFVKMEKHDFFFFVLPVHLTIDPTNKYEPKWTLALLNFTCEAAFPPPFWRIWLIFQRNDADGSCNYFRFLTENIQLFSVI